MLFLTLHESKPTSLTVSWSGEVKGAHYHTVALELPSGGTLSSPKIEQPVATYTIAEGLKPATEYGAKYVIAWDERGNEVTRGSVAFFSTSKDDSRMSGLVLVFNMTKERPGGEVDQRRVCELFGDMRFQVVLRENPTTEMVADTCNWARKEMTDVSCFFCIVMAHGRAGNKVSLFDGEIDLKEDIFSHFKGNKCKAMLGKPKVFIVNACRGPVGR